MGVTIKHKWVVYNLEEAVYGIGNKGIEHNEYSFSLHHTESFDTEEECVKFITDTFIDFITRGVHKDNRYIALKTYYCDDDEIFK